MPPEPPPAPRPGERLPDFLLPPEDCRQPTFYERYCGGPAVLLIADRPADALDAVAQAARTAGVPVHRLVPPAAAPASGASPGIADQRDDGRLARALLGPTPTAGPVALVLDATLRLVARLERPSASAVAAALAPLTIEPGPATAAPIATAAPVLIVPGVLETELCARLVAAYESENVDSPMVRAGADGGTALVADAAAKRRRDHSLADGALVRAVSDRLARRVLPEIARGFHYAVTRFERFKVVAYAAADQGHFAAHRDNTTPDARHRRFALSVNLDDGYEGGTLAFPEFGAADYRPPAGAAIVFSGSLLHAVRPVTAGRRHVLISFLWGEEARTGDAVSRREPPRAGA